MEELTIWEQHTITLSKDPKLGFGFAISGGRDKPHPDSGDTAIVVSDVLPNGPAMGRLFTKDHIVMVNGESMENVHSNFTIQSLKSCGKMANITVKRPRKIQIPVTNKPSRAASHSNLLDQDPPSRRPRRYSDGSDKGRDANRYHSRGRSSTPDRNGHSNTLPLMSSGYKRLPQQNVADKPIRTTLVKKKLTDEYGLKLGSQIFIKHMTETGLAAKEGTLQEGDLILKINGMTTENLSLLETKHLVEKSRGKLTMMVLRDDRKFLVSIPEVEDSAPNSEDDRRHDSSSELEDISDLDTDIPSPRDRMSRPTNRERRTRRTRAEPPPAKSRDSSPVRSTLTRPPARAYPSRRAPSDSESDRSASPPPARRDRDSPDLRDQSNKYRTLSGVSTLPNPRASPVHHNWNAPRPTSSASRPRRPVSESDSDRNSPPPPRRESPRPDRYKVLPDLPVSGMRASPIPVRQPSPRRINSPVRVPPPDSESESDGSSGPPPRQGNPYNQDSLSRYRVLPDLSQPPQVEPPRWSTPSVTASNPPQRAPSESESEASYASVPRRDSTDSGNSKSNKPKGRYRVLSETGSFSASVKQEPPRRAATPQRPPPDDSSESDQLAHLRRSGSSERESNHNAPRAANGTGTLRSGISVKSNLPVYSKPTEEPIYSLPPDSYPAPNPGYSSDLNTVSFVKEGSVGLRLVGGNDVGIFVGGVQPKSPAYEQGMKEGDQIMKVNKVDFGHFTREEAANFLLNIKRGEQVEICTQNKIDLYKKILKSNLGDNFYIRTHFDHEADGPIGLSFTRGEVFRVVDTMHRGKLGNWLAIRMGNDLHELDKGTIPNQARADNLASMEQAQRASGEKQVSGPRAEFWKLRGLRGGKKNVRRTRDDLLQLTIQGKFPAYEKVLLREANFKRPIVILGPLNDIAMDKLVREMPDEYEIAAMVPRSGGGDSGSTVIKLDTVRKIAEKDKHPLLDITPTAVERLNYIQYHPMVLFLDPHSRKDVKAMRQRYSPNSNKSSRRLYAQALKMRKHCSHLFSARVDLQPSSNVWYEILKDKIRHQQAKPVWVSEVTLESGGEQDLDALDRTHSDYLSAASDLEDTDGEAFTDGEAYTDNEDLDEAFPSRDVARPQHSSMASRSALARSSEPASGRYSPDMDEEPQPESYTLREVPPLMHVPEPKSSRHGNYSPPHSAAEAEEVSSYQSFSDTREPAAAEEAPVYRSFSDSDFSNTDLVAPTTPSDGPPDFVAPDPSTLNSVSEPPLAEAQLESPQPENPQPARLSAIEEKLQQARLAEPQAAAEEKKASPQFIVLAHHQAVQYRRTQIRGSDSSEEEDETDDIEWGPATEL
ncbi:tight junction protein ZO-3 [Myripristis murdjan]|uniref:Tight junction protein 3 n=1 Tax=Myripristis murdjan TaxID=586833 RepID=A0A667YNX2_9TELE|nr:tight junction protein ZO-3-like [Myripristis murdjan]XP_029904740.1 tight junction protein ZO-3-like [Myripristis murdjan]XP_029904741.1 tight junction protein ZO-3-like [Myripristis murdjan]